jgi:hypothetical protein
VVNCGGCNLGVIIQCSPVWEVIGFLGGTSLPQVAASVSCSPFQVVFLLTGVTECCTGNIVLTLTP